ncbi:hypothetical protein CLF_102078 [Clonorchis sinensis]|uniref:Letm1 RBD domain-containing protein n=1 Tax=Clonorchis sinensis TaxID=79923 RepID=G7Y787_CLOSI|nr:hypothetical protein CLF_102078 [Clonorchis sinensis]
MAAGHRRGGTVERLVTNRVLLNYSQPYNTQVGFAVASVNCATRLHSTLLDINDLLRLWTKLSFDNRSIIQYLPVMTQRELYVLRQVPRDLLRLSPVLLLAPLPGTVFLLPFFFAHPYVFLNRAFWTEKQRSEYDSKQLRYRLSVPRDELIRSLHQTTENVKKSPGVSLATVQRFSALDELLDKLRCSGTPLHRELIAVSSVFDDQLNLDNLSKVHVFNLCRLHGLPVRIRLSMFTRWPCTRIYLEPKYFHFRRLRLLRFRAALLSCEDRLVHRTMIQYSGTVAPPLAELRDIPTTLSAFTCQYSLRNRRLLHQRRSRQFRRMERAFTLRSAIGTSGNPSLTHALLSRHPPYFQLAITVVPSQIVSL